jgi:hypothetical protein
MDLSGKFRFKHLDLFYLWRFCEEFVRAFL